MIRIKKGPKIILLATIFLIMAVFASACAVDGSYADQRVIGVAADGGDDQDYIAEEETGENADELPQIEDNNLEDQDAVIEGEGQDQMIADIPYFFTISGTVESVDVTETGIQIKIQDTNDNPAIINITDETVFPFSDVVVEGDEITAWYATNVPMMMIWPPHYNVDVLAVNTPKNLNIKVERFEPMTGSDDLMLSKDGLFAFRTDDNTKIILADGSDFIDGDLNGRLIVVVYGASTRSIPEQAIANELIVLFETAVTLPETVD